MFVLTEATDPLYMLGRRWLLEVLVLSWKDMSYVSEDRGRPSLEGRRRGCGEGCEFVGLSF